MKTEIGKTEHNKQRERRAGAALSFSDKLRVVEKLRGSAIIQIRDRKDDVAVLDKPGRNRSGSLLLDLIQQTADGLPRRTAVVRGSDEDETLTEQAEQLFKDKANALAALNALFPEGIPTGVIFFERLTELEMRLGWTQTSRRIAGLLLLVAIQKLPLSAGALLLNELPNIRGPAFFQALDSLQFFLAEWELRPEFAAEWFPRLVHRIGNDLASGGFWTALGIYSEKHPHNSLIILRLLSARQSDEQIAVAAYILGTLRSIILDEAATRDLNKLEQEFASSVDIHVRTTYNRSWIQTAWRGKMTKRDLEVLIARMSRGAADEREQVFWIVSRVLLSPEIPGDFFTLGLTWLLTHVSGSISPTAKFNAVDFAARLPRAHRKSAAQLIILLQPVSTEYKGIWQRVEHFLVEWMHEDFEGFTDFCLELAYTNASGWLEVLMAPQCFEWFISELSSRDASKLVTKLTFSSLAPCRHLGLFLFEKLGLDALDTGLINAVETKQIKIAFYELQRRSLQGRATAKFLIVLIPYVEQIDEAFQADFHAELVLQIKNYPESVRASFEQCSERFPILKDALETSKRYFDALRRVIGSSINTFEVSGYRQAVRLHARRLSNSVSNKSEETSIFLHLIKKVQLLYGNTWSAFTNGKLGESSGLQEFSTSFEVPRLEEIDPEGMVFRRSHASAQIAVLSRSMQRDENADQ